MSGKDRRRAHRYTTERSEVTLGWYVGDRFRTLPARLSNLSVTGALVQVDPHWDRPQTSQFWISLPDAKLAQWIEADALPSGDDRQQACFLRLKLTRALPYEVFKHVVWSETTDLARKLQAALCPTPQAGGPSDNSPAKVSTASMIQRDPSASVHGSSPQANESPDARPPARAEDSPYPPSLQEARQQWRSLQDRVDQLPWITLSAICLGLVVLLATVIVSRLDLLRWVATILRVTS